VLKPKVSVNPKLLPAILAPQSKHRLTHFSLQISPFLALSLSLSLSLHSFTLSLSLRPSETERSDSNIAMLRRATSSLLSGISRRRLSTDVPATPAADSSFAEAWKKVSSNLEPPKTPLSFMKPRPPTPSTLPSKLTVNFVLPYASQLSAKEVTFFSCSLNLSKLLFPFVFFCVSHVLICGCRSRVNELCRCVV